MDFNSLIQDYALPWSIKIGAALLVFIVGKFLISIVLKLVKKGLIRAGKLDEMLINFIMSISGAVLLLVVIIAALDQLGVDTTSLVALIGAAGLAVGLALKDSMQDFASGVMILVFKPFKTGDFVEAGGVSGVAEKVQLFTTTFRTGDNKEIIVPNSSIYSGSITNYSARDTRRVDMVFGISYDDDIRLAKQILERLVSEDERILPEPAPVIALSELGASSVDFIVRPWVNSGDYWKVKWEMNEKVKQAFDDAGVSIPYPQMDVHLHTESAAVSEGEKN
ncbi:MULTISPECIES: mechanosensitive ion channel family protein [Thiomicrorhabdus]|uniref:Small-conductance mechanosensitive channel n=1 Tax=Thiomicrorhabdus heinhorstiae TaxID=2748010 RepID=A0ABS0BW57_9GAMM|nr:MULTISPECIES: mechanosensitive ion channel domain-containing protein [Thiomicrorhabdus]MBF6057624.1 mechanosensitive ion channel [Thiomicrorhabdus heinhorstiae]